MPISWQTTQNGPARNVAIPIVPAATDSATITANGTVDRRTYTLSATNLTNSRIDAYIHYIAMYAQKTAAASGIDITWQWQFFNGVGVAVGAIVPIFTASVGWNGAAAAGVANNVEYFPTWPDHVAFAIPATAVTLRLQSVAANIAGAPSISCRIGNGADLNNAGPPGDIGGLGSVAYSASSANQF